jgi:hypothetical protein
MAQFSISGPWLTERLRDLWKEGSYRMAIRILESQEIPLDIGMTIIHGSSKLIDGDQPGFMVTAQDTWQPKPDDCYNEQYPGLGDLLQLLDENHNAHILQQTVEIKTGYATLAQSAIRGDGAGIGLAISQLMTYPAPLLTTVLGAEAMHQLYRGLIPSDISSGISLEGWLTDKEIACLKRTALVAPSSLESYIHDLECKLEYYEEQATVPEVTVNPIPPVDIEQMATTMREHQHTLESLPPPIATVNFAEGFYGGWISPKGEFFPCEYPAAHDILLSKLVRCPPEAALELGWLRLTKKEDEWSICKGDCPQGLNQSQLNTIYDWEEFTTSRKGVLSSVSTDLF